MYNTSCSSDDYRAAEATINCWMPHIISYMCMYKYGTARFKLDHSCALYLASNTTLNFVECMIRNSCFGLICSHDSKYCECYTQATGAISECACEILTNIR